MLRAISESAARGWKFIKLPAASPERTKTLIFNFQPGEIVFIDESESADSVKIRKTFTSTYSAEVFSDYLIPRLLLLPREKGNIKPESCELHHELEEVEIVNFSCEHRNNTAIAFERSSEYNDAEDELFPNASPEDMLGCSANGIERKEIHYCASCRIARNNWLQINRK